MEVDVGKDNRRVANAALRARAGSTLIIKGLS